MLLTYEALRSKNKEKIGTRKISLPIGDFRQLLTLDGVIISLVKQDIKNLPKVDKFGTAYVGDINILEIEITNEDNTDAMTEEQFREYFKEISNIPLKWSKTEGAELNE